MASNPPDVHNLLHQAMDALTRGDKPLARDLLTTVLEMDDRNEQAWLWLSGAVDSPHEQRICLENVLTINPGSTAARQGLAYLEKQEAEHPTPPPAQAAAPQPATAAPAAQPAAAPQPAMTAPPAAPVVDYPAPQEAAVPAAVAPNYPPAVPPEWTAAPAAPPPGWGNGPAASAPAAPASKEAPASAIPAEWGSAPAAPAASAPGVPQWDAGATGASVPGWDTPAAPAPAWGSPAPPPAWSIPPPSAPAPAPPDADPWAALRADLAAPPTPAPASTPPASNGGMLGAAANSSWMDAFGSGPSAPLASPGPWTGGSSASGTVADNLGVTPFTFDATGGPPAADNPWSEVEAAVPGLAGFDMGAPSGGEVSLPPDLSGGTSVGGTVLPSDSPWADTFGGASLGQLPQAGAEEPFLQVRQPDAGHPAYGRENLRGSSPALIARPPIGGRSATPVPTIPCPNCGEMVTDNALSCPRCQYRFYAPCPHCGDYIDTSDPNPRGHDVCPHCQQPVDKKALGQAPARGSIGRPGAPSSTPPTVMVGPTPKNKKKTKSPREDKQAAAVAAAAWTPDPAAAPPRSNAAGRILALIVVLAVLGFVIFVLPHMLNVPTLLTPELTPTP
ncbi:MAG TPA: zinc ribbon domain-containing protein [Chloroflexia bacterium]